MKSLTYFVGAGRVAVLVGWLLFAPLSLADDGLVTTDFNNDSDSANAGVVTSDGCITAYGTVKSASANGYAMAATRHLQDGTPDTTFGGGKVVVPNYRDYRDNLTCGAVQVDRKVLLSGIRYQLDSLGFQKNISWVIARVTASGALDKTFNRTGTQTTALAGKSPLQTSTTQAPVGVVVQSDGKIVVAGNYEDGVGSRYHIAVIRYNANGSLDTTFGTSGIARPTIPGVSGHNIQSVVLNGSKILMAGVGVTPDRSQSGILVVQLNANGSLDSTFGVGGVVYSPRPDVLFYGKRVFADATGIVVGATVNLVAFPDIAWGAIIRYTPSGLLDTSFGENGILQLAVGDGSLMAMDGPMLVLGEPLRSEDPVATGYALSVRFPDGTLDTSFGVDGIAENWLGVQVNHVVVNPAGDLFGFGRKFVQRILPDETVVSSNDFAVFKHLSDGTLDLDF